MQTVIRVRPAGRDDCPAIHSIASETWRATYHGLIPEQDIEAFLQSNYGPQQLERAIERMAGGFLLASVQGQPAGYASVSLDRDGNAQLWTIYVRPGNQGAGVGKALWDAAVSQARSLGPASLVLWVLEDNRQARAFYECQGAAVSAQRDFPVGAASISEIQYTLPLR